MDALWGMNATTRCTNNPASQKNLARVEGHPLLTGVGWVQCATPISQWRPCLIKIDEVESKSLK